VLGRACSIDSFKPQTVSTIKNLRERLEALETALQDAGLALLLARENADKDDLKRVLEAFELTGPRNKRRVEWLEEMGRVAAWHEGLCASSTADVEIRATGQSAGITKPDLDRDVDAL
jgi:hypothetical protein